MKELRESDLIEMKLRVAEVSVDYILDIDIEDGLMFGDKRATYEFEAYIKFCAELNGQPKFSFSIPATGNAIAYYDSVCDVECNLNLYDDVEFLNEKDEYFLFKNQEDEEDELTAEFVFDNVSDVDDYESEIYGHMPTLKDLLKSNESAKTSSDI